MKPDAYLRLYPGDWLKDTLRLDATAMGAYFLLILDHRGKPGIPSDDQTLRTIARVRESDWMRVKGQIACYFVDKAGMWVNNRCVEDWERDCADYRTACDRTAKASKTRWAGSVTDNVTDSVTDNVTSPQSESESESESQGHEINKKGGPPTLTQVKAKAGMVGIPETEAEKFWHHFEAVGWVDKNGNRITRWESKLMTWQADARARPLEQAAKGTNGHSVSDRVQLNQELQRILPQISQITNGAASDAMGKRFYAPGDATRLKELKSRRDEIKKLIGAKY